MLNKIKITFIIIISLNTTYSQDYIDSSQFEIPRILETYDNYKKMYEDKANSLLIHYIENDEIIKKQFLMNDSIEIGKLTVKIIPILTFSNEAINFKIGENIFKYLVYDTINFQAVFNFYKGEDIIFKIIPGFDNCSGEVISPGEKRIIDEEENVAQWKFLHNYYKSTSNNFAIIKRFDEVDSLFMFIINGIGGAYKIIENSICYDKGLGYGRDIWVKNDANNMLNNLINEDWVHFSAKWCSPGSKKKMDNISKPIPFNRRQEKND